MRQAVGLISVAGGQCMIKCNCTSSCATNRCSCKKSQLLYNSRCHGDRPFEQFFHVLGSKCVSQCSFYRSSLHVISINSQELKNFSCNCWFWQKYYIYKHIITIAFNLNICIIYTNIFIFRTTIRLVGTATTITRSITTKNKG
ncbi:KRAB-A domain-containing 2-like [Brachionus plicatilis]|uniref:KRAB-A domain-containing 2-like n=1 Tax=Brachionus plicatilis TaxID=10195 RepID=A0A3M7PMW1_BRAPC|nr:KRAB-A domain-containing 2-like [Brachionus plicatilis]